MSLEKIKRQLLVENKRLRKELEELRQLVGIDPLTKAFNRHQIKKEVARAKRDKSSLGILMIDVNNFKQINKRFGHPKGDKALLAVAEVLRQSVRQMDSVIRYGGDEFLVILPEIKESLDKIIRRILHNLKEKDKREPILKKGYPVSIAIGGAIWHPENKKTWEEALEEADKVMYRHKEHAKEEGEK